ncbi:hypothetical protein [Chryseobacterium sp.]|uniref:hypothetical protein n=1 Tax=Chryseobacterium sp. TaxID=1871047 RepID=UPI00262778E5|nr:hypothetical protein [Chryseobacterium sp.]
MEFQNERQIADRAKQILGSKLQSRANSFKQHVNGSGAAVKDVEVVTGVRRYTKNGNTKSYFNSLSIKMGKHGFIQNFGVDTQRKGGTRKRKRPKSISYNFKSHYFKLKAVPFINESIEQSKVIPFVLENVMKVRTEDFFLETRNILTRQSH